METKQHQDFDTLFREAEMALHRGRLDEAEQLFRQCLELDPNSAKAWNKLGVVIVHKGNKDKAKQCFQQAIKLDPKFAPAYSNLGNIYRETGNLAAAEKLYETAIKHDPNFATAYHNLGVVLKQQGKIYEGVNHLKRAGKLERQAARAEFQKVPQKQRNISIAIILALLGGFIYLLYRALQSAATPMP